MTALKKGSKGPQVKELQKLLNRYFLSKNKRFKKLDEDGDFGRGTEKAVIKFQSDNGLEPDGIAGSITMNKLNGNPAKDENGYDITYKNVVIEGSTFPGKPYSNTVPVVFSKEMREEYIPEMEKTLTGSPIGLKLLVTVMANKEGFYKKSRSYKTNNPGNIGNTDSGKNSSFKTLKEGIEAQKIYVEKVANGKHPAFPLGKKKEIKPFFSEEIARNQKTYGISPWLPGYRFVYTGQLDQYVKIYSTGARAGNNYINTIVSWFKKNGITINAESKIQDIINID